MKDTSPNQKTSHNKTSASEKHASAGPAGAAFTPPSYGIESLDLASNQAAPLQMKADSSSGGDDSRSALPNHTGLPDALKTGVEVLSGLAMNDVQVHYNSPRPAQLQAFAYTRGTEIHVGPGQERYLPHEAWHVVQQKQGRVRSTIQTRGVQINADKGMEHEADSMGVKALQTKASPSRIDGVCTAGHVDTPVQRAQINQPAVPAAPGHVTQLASTELGFENNLTGKSKITRSKHARSGVHKTAADWVLTNGAWKSVPDGTVCNHSRAYDPVAQKILDAIHNKRLFKAAETVKDIYESLEANDEGISAAMSKHVTRMQAVIDNPDDDISADDITDTFNYYLYKIGDYPRNLFFWPAKAGGDPDEPVGQYGTNGDWKVRSSGTTNKARLSKEKNRLESARDDLKNALP